MNDLAQLPCERDREPGFRSAIVEAAKAAEKAA
jgi:hypothetical protein